MSTTYIVGHTKPDTDAIVAAMGLAYLYNQSAQSGNHEAVITDPLNPETTFLFEKFAVQSPRRITALDIKSEDSVILVDHNEQEQRLEGMNADQIVEIVDHHKFNCNLQQPIAITCKPWGSSSTIVYDLMKQHSVVPDQKLASLLLAAILSDTVGFKSATTTNQDVVLGKELVELAQITDVDAFTLEIFKAKSNISTLSDEEIVTNDYKVFDFAQKTLIDQLETVEQERVLTERKASLLEAMQRVKMQMGVALIFVAITDILQVNTKLLILGDAEAAVAQKAFGGTVVDNILDIGAKMSRKKEIAPPIEKALM